MLGGETDFSIVDAASVGPLLASGKVKLLAVAADKRLPSYPELPTTAEAGVPNYKETAPFGLYIRTGTPPAIVEKLNATLKKIDENPEVVAQLAKFGWQPHWMNRADSNAFYRAEIAKWKDIVAEAHIPTND